MKYYGEGFGRLYTSDLLEEYIDRIEDLNILEPFDASEKEIESILERSLRNGKTFYENAPENIREDMRLYEKRLREGVDY